MRKLALGFCLLVAAHSVLADVALTDKKSAARVIGQSVARLTPEQKQVLRDANKAKKDAKKASKRKDARGVSTDSFRPGSNATGSFSLIDSGSLQYFVNTNITFSTSSSASGAASEASYTAALMASTSAGGVVTSTLSDFADGYNGLCVSLTNATGPCATGNPAYSMYFQNGPASFDTTVPVTPECTNRQIVLPAKTIGALNVQRKVYVPTNDQFIRWSNSFTNTSGAPVTFTMITSNNLGSDSNTRLVSSSSGDAVAQTTDLWVSTFQNYSGSISSDPRIGHVLQGAGAATPVSNVSFVDGDDNPYWAYSITLAPGQTKIILNYATGLGSKAAANAKAAALAALPATTTQCLSTTELSQVVNFAVSTDLSITKSASVPTVLVGGALSYTLNVSNAGPSSANSVSVTDTLPAGTGFVSASGTGWTCGEVAGTVTCTLPSLAIGAANPITINVTAPVTPGITSNTATVSSANTDPVPGNNTSPAATVDVTGNADLSIVKTANTASTETFVPLTYTLAVSNAGPSAATNVTVTDTLVAGSVFQSASGTGWTCGAAGQVVTCTRPSLAVGAAPPISLTVVPTSESGTLSNTASVSSDANDPTPVNASTAAVALFAGSQIPALDPSMLALLMALIGVTAMIVIRRNG